MYVATTGEHTLAFTGDFLFMGGTGMFFEGTAPEMRNCFESLTEICPPETHLFYGHEYGENNLRFCVWVDPDNETALSKLEEVEGKMDKKEANVPGLLSEELNYNIFMRTNEEEVMLLTKTECSDDCLTHLRAKKDKDAHKKSDLYKEHTKERESMKKLKKAD